MPERLLYRRCKSSSEDRLPSSQGMYPEIELWLSVRCLIVPLCREVLRPILKGSAIIGNASSTCPSSVGMEPEIRLR